MIAGSTKIKTKIETKIRTKIKTKNTTKILYIIITVCGGYR